LELKAHGPGWFGAGGRSQLTTGEIYMDHAATTATDPRVVEAMVPYFAERYGNPSSMYSVGVIAAEAVENARKLAADFIGAKANEIYFTSGGTESDNWAIKGVAYANMKKGRHLITSAIEHHAVLEPCEFLAEHGFEVTFVPVDSEGLVDPDDVRKAIRPDTTLISIMHANNEIGTIEPIAEIGCIAREAGVIFHTDAVQTVGKIPVNVDELNVDLLSASAHKFYGPKGVGFLYRRGATRISPFMHGGGQERKKRASTHNVPGIVGLGKAVEIAAAEMAETAEKLDTLTARLRAGLEERISDVRFNGASKRVPGIVHICVEGVEGEAMMLCLDMNRICVSTGSACTTETLEPSHVLLAIGIPAERAHGSVRFSLGAENTVEQVDYVLEEFPSIVSRLRAMSPTYNK